MQDKDWILIMGILVTLALGIYNIFHTSRSTKRRDFISTVTSERVKWIESLRQNVSKYTGKVHSYFHLFRSDKTEAQKLLFEIDVLNYLIRLQLNLNEEPDHSIQTLLEVIPLHAAGDNFHALKTDLDQLTSLTQSLLKKEWEKVKYESQGGRLT